MDTTPRTLGYTELWDRMRRALAVEGDQALCGWTESEPPPAYFSPDGRPRTLLGHVLADLGVSPDQVVANLLPDNHSDPEVIFAAAGFPLTAVASTLAVGAWCDEMRGVLWTGCIRTLDDLGPYSPGWLPQDAVPLADVEGTAGSDPVDITAITATFPATQPPGLAGAPDFQLGYEAWMQAAERAGAGTAWTISRSTFEVDPSCSSPTCTS